MLMLSRAEDLEGVSLAVSGVGDYKRFFDEVGLNQGNMGAGNMQGGAGGDQKTLEDLFYMKEAELSKLVFTRQFTHAVIYAWVKLREQVRHFSLRVSRSENANAEQEIRNITWISECIAQNQKDRIGNYISVF